MIRSEKDRGLIVLMDSRFVQHFKFPRPLGEPACPVGRGQGEGSMSADWFDSDVNELVSGRILKDVAEFWRGPLPLSER